MRRNYRKKTYKKKIRRSRRTKYGRKTNLKKVIRRTINQMSETKTWLQQYENIQLFHNMDNYFISDPWSFIVKGTDGKTRIGDRIRNRGIAIKLWMSNKADRPNLTYRVMLFTSPQAINANLINVVNVSSYLWRQGDGGACGNGLILKVQKEYGFRVLYDRLFPVKNPSGGTSSGSDKECHIVKKLFIRPKRSGIIQYSDVGGGSKGRWLFGFICAYDSKGTLTSDNVGSYAASIEMFYKDF